MNRTTNPLRDRNGASRRRDRGTAPRIESLEDRALLAANVFTPPNISGLLAAAQHGHNTSVATINTELGALRNQLTAALKASTTQAGATAAVTGILTTFNQSIDAQLRPRFANVANITELSSAKVSADLTSVQTQFAVGSISQATALSQAQTIVSTLNTGPLRASGTSNQALVNRSRQFSTDLNTLGQSLSTTATSPLTIANVSTLTTAQGNAYLADMKASLYGRNAITNALTANVTTLQTEVAAIAAGTGTGTGTVQAQYLAAVSTFNASQQKLLRAIG